MKVTKEKVENSQAFLTIEMEPADMEEGYKDAYRHLVQTANIPGFRKGKAPRAVVERTLGKGRMLEEAIDHMVPDAYQKALAEQKIEPYAQPQVEITKAEPLVFKAIVPLIPTVTLGDYRGIRMQPEVEEIKEDKVNSVMEELRHQHATWEPVDRPVQYNDLAVLDINADDNEDKPLVKKASSQYQVLKDSITPAPGFADQLIGMKKEDKKEFELKFPDDYPSKQLAGKQARFKVTLHEIKEEKLPELDDDFAKHVSTQFTTIEDVRKEAEKGLKMQAEERARMNFEEKAINTAVEQSKIEYPPVVIDIEIERIINDQARQLQMTGQGMDEYLQSINKTPEQLVEDLRPIAKRNVEASLVLSQISEDEKIEVTEEEIINGINNMVRSIGQEKQDEMRKLLDTPKTRQSLTQSIKTRKTIERLTDIAKEKKEESVKDKKEEENMTIRPENVIPMVIESGARGERAFDIYSLLLRERIIFLGSAINDQVANVIIAQLLYLDREDPEKDISLYINSPGGVITSGLAIYDTMQLVRPQVSTICVGWAASMGTVLLCAGAKGKRFSLPNSTIHMHQALGGAQGQAADIVIAAREITRQQETIKEIFVKHTGQPMEKITHDTDRDFYLNAQGAKEYNLIDDILEPSLQKGEKEKVKAK